MISVWEDNFGGMNSENKKYFYKLENISIVKLNSKKEGNFHNSYFSWQLTEKGKMIIESNSLFSKLWKDGKIKELYKKLIVLND